LKRLTSTKILYGIPPAKLYIERLAAWKRKLKVELILMVDHVAQIKLLQDLIPHEEWLVFIKIDCGTHRAGLEPQSDRLRSLIQSALNSDRIRISGFYCHSGHSYASRSLKEAENHLLDEICSGSAAARLCLDYRPGLKLTISVGATPTAHAASSAILEQVQNIPGKLELHAGNYAVLDLQQVCTGLAGLGNIASWVEAEVCSVYPERREMLVNVGSLGLGREPGQESGVWGYAKILHQDAACSSEEFCWNVVRISQEHGILAPRTSDPMEQEQLFDRVAVGARVRIIPQHACIAGAMHDSYIVVDEDDGECVDEWFRCRGW
jgi:D-serine ammonia-lyase